MKKLIILLVIIVLTSCSSYKRTKFEYQLGSNKNEWINNFKTEFFFTCIKKAYKNDTIFNLISKKDFQYHYEPFAYQHDKIDTLANRIIEKMPKPIYPHCDDCDEKQEKEDAQKNYFCASCLNYYASRELDSIAKNEYKKICKNFIFN